MVPDIVDRLRAMAGPIEPNVCTEAAVHIETIRRAIEILKEDLTLAKRQRDEARRQYCRGFTDFCPNPRDENLSLEDAAVEVAKRFGWDCFKEAKP